MTLQAAQPTINHRRLAEIIAEVEAAAADASSKVGGPNEGDYYRGLRDAEEWVVRLLRGDE